MTEQIIGILFFILFVAVLIILGTGKGSVNKYDSTDATGYEINGRAGLDGGSDSGRNDSFLLLGWLWDWK